MKKARFFIALASSLLFIRGALAAPEYISNFASFPAYPYNTSAYKQGGAFVGCGPTVGAMMFSYFQAVHSLPNLLTNPGTAVNKGLNTAWSLHGATYMNTGADGFGSVLNIKPGLERYAEDKGYTLKVLIHAPPYYDVSNTFYTTYGTYGEAWTNDASYQEPQADGSWKYNRSAFCDFVAPLLADGIAIFLAIDSDGNGSGDHWVPLVGYDRAAGTYAFYDTYSTTLQWADIYYCYDKSGKKVNSISLLRTVTLSLPDIASNPAAGSFGSVSVGGWQERSFTLSNAGTTDLNVTAVTLSGANASEFSIQSGGGSFSLTAGVTRNIVLRFTPASAGSKGASLNIASNDPDENPFTISLGGIGGPAPDILTIVIDGQKDSWYDQLTGPDEGYIHIPGFMHNENGAPDNDKDLSADLWVAWDANYLYVYEEVKDNFVHLNNPTNYQNDCLEIYFDPNPSLKKITGPPGFRLSALDSADVADPANLSGVANIKIYASFAATKADYSRRLTADGYALECRVKWDWIQMPGWGPPVPAVGNSFGMAVMNHDNDVSRREGSIEWAAALKDAVFNDTQLHGTVTFEADHRLKLEAKNAIVPANVNADAWAYVPGADLFRIAIDGEKDAWYNELTGPDEGYIHIPGFLHNDNGAPDNDKDLSADLWVAWDATYLYVYEEVKDNAVHLNNPTTWQNDCLEMYFDPDPSLKKITGPTGFGLSALDSADVEDSANLSGVADMSAFRSYAVTKADYGRRLTEDGYALECRVKWDWIQMTGWGPPVPAVGNSFGMAVMNHDNDVSRREGSISWAAVLKDAVWNDTQLHGTVTFEADHRLKLEAKNAIVPTNVNADAWAYVPGADLFRIAIDAEKDPWYNELTGPDQGYVHIPFFMHNDDGSPDNNADLSANLWTAWDDTYLYLYEEVVDDVVHLNNAISWHDDCLEIYLDPDLSKAKTSGQLGFHMTALDSADTDNAYFAGVTNMTGYNCNLGSTKADYARKKTANGYVLEGRVRWDAIKFADGSWGPLSPAIGKAFGMSTMNHDNDVSARDASISWAAVLKDAVWNDPRLHGTVTLEADHKLKMEAKNSIVPENVNADAWAYVPGTDMFRIAIDGHKDPFYETLTGPDDGYLQIRYFANSNIGLPKGGDPDLSAKVWSAWDDDWYYIYAEVTDDSVSAATVSNDWETDAMELKIDGQATDSTQTAVSNGTIITALDSTEVAKGLITNSLNGLAEGDKQYARRKFDGGYVLEYALKLSMLGGNEPIDAGVGKVFGMAYHFIDNDGKGRNACIQWSAFLNDMIWNTPKFHATVKFLADNKLQFIPSNNMTGLTNPVPYDGSDDPSRMAVEDKTGIVKEFALSQNYPNPFNPTTTISYSIPLVSTVRLTVFDIMGRQVAVLVDEKKAPGIYKVNFDGRRMASGIYFYKLEAGSHVFKQKMAMLK